MEHDTTANDMANKYYKTIQKHLQENDIDMALKTLRNLSEIAESKKGLNRPMIQLFASKALMEIHREMAKLEIEANKKPDNSTVNIYTTLREEGKEGDIREISRRLNVGLSNAVKR